MFQKFLKSFGFLIKSQRYPMYLCTVKHIRNLSQAQHTFSNQQGDLKNQNVKNTDSTRVNHPLDLETQREVQHHSSYAGDWWNANGSMKALHSLNSIRVPFIRDGLIARGNISPELVNTCNVLKNQKILEVGCGGGILTEQLARLGAYVTGIDLSDELIRAARQHLSQETDSKLCDRIEYKIEPLDVHVKDKINYYDAVIVSEVLEHVDDKIGLLTAVVQSLKPGGSLFITTVNKTLKMWVGGVILAEYVLKIAPVGTHHWNKMISPLEVQRILDTMGCHTVVINGSTYDFLRNSWCWINSTDMCYALQAVKTEI